MPEVDFAAFAARVNSCPDTNQFVDNIFRGVASAHDGYWLEERAGYALGDAY
jgi:hypothetical protein